MPMAQHCGVAGVALLGLLGLLARGRRGPSSGTHSAATGSALPGQGTGAARLRGSAGIAQDVQGDPAAWPSFHLSVAGKLRAACGWRPARAGQGWPSRPSWPSAASARPGPKHTVAIAGTQRKQSVSALRVLHAARRPAWGLSGPRRASTHVVQSTTVDGAGRARPSGTGRANGANGANGTDRDRVPLQEQQSAGGGRWVNLNRLTRFLSIIVKIEHFFTTILPDQCWYLPAFLSLPGGRSG